MKTPRSLGNAQLTTSDSWQQKRPPVEPGLEGWRQESLFSCPRLVRFKGLVREQSFSTETPNWPLVFSHILFGAACRPSGSVPWLHHLDTPFWSPPAVSLHTQQGRMPSLLEHSLGTAYGTPAFPDQMPQPIPGPRTGLCPRSAFPSVGDTPVCRPQTLGLSQARGGVGVIVRSRTGDRLVPWLCYFPAGTLGSLRILNLTLTFQVT